ncbi:hypothetical protein H6G00_22545 [Leptolyngbya sp. FACHB-541]|uniref:hypothetical protein n=1 Tax=Leptolyngbya sp. FACHB-541 TaxID=2692810 RepID=UPI001682945D|nr:hypothetical protein [Leptolyngbya sp. FACHB-541]MBD1999355.1 hypothetical protein [Leptolyngbya sp. FACHB-541]
MFDPTELRHMRAIAYIYLPLPRNEAVQRRDSMVTDSLAGAAIACYSNAIRS